MKNKPISDEKFKESVYRKKGTYLAFEKETNEVIRWTSDKTLFFAGSEEDALEGLNKTEFYAKRVIDCPKELQDEYEKRIDECILSGEIDL